MTYTIRKATVIGAGTMGAGIAAHLANAGIFVDLLDIVPPELTPKELSRGLSRRHPSVRNRLAEEGLAREKANPVSGFYTSRVSERVRVGNLEDHFDWLRDSDWVIEAVVENLEVKQALMMRIDGIRKLDAIVTSNTSGLPIRDVCQGTSQEFSKHFLGTHFFNPPRVMKLLEVIPGPQTDADVLGFMIRFCEQALGKGVVVCKDTPNFIANRIAALQRSFDMEYVLAEGYTVEQADAILGELIGRPRTALFRLGDLVGIDVSTMVGENLYQLIPRDEHRELLVGPRSVKLRKQMIDANLLGRKTGGGFYKRVDTPEGAQYWGLDLDTLEFRAPIPADIPRLKQAGEIEDLGERIHFLISEEDQLGKLVWASLSNVFLYAAYCVPEISDDLLSVDRAMRWGYSWDLGPFELWDQLGVSRIARRLHDDGVSIASWVLEMLDSGVDSFYAYEQASRYQYSPITSTLQIIADDPRTLSASSLRRRYGAGVETRHDAGLLDLGDGVAYLRVDPKGWVADGEWYDLLDSALDTVADDFEGLVLSRLTDKITAGVSISKLVELIKERSFEGIEELLLRTRALLYRLRRFPKPVVFASEGRLTGLDALLSFSSAHRCLHAETSIGFEEVKLGLLPVPGGCVELLRSGLQPIERHPSLDPLPILRQIFDLIARANTTGNAEEAREQGYLTQDDHVVMNPDHVLHRAKQVVLTMNEEGLKPTVLERSIFTLGERAKAALSVSVFLRSEAGFVSDHDERIARELVHVLSGGDLTSPQWVDESYIMDLEREAFLSLCGEEKTLDRLEHFLQTGKVLRN